VIAICKIDGRTVSVSVHRYRERWAAAAADLGQVAIGLHGAGIEISEIALVSGNDTPSDYNAPQR